MKNKYFEFFPTDCGIFKRITDSASFYVGRKHSRAYTAATDISEKWPE